MINANPRSAIENRCRCVPLEVCHIYVYILCYVYMVTAIKLFSFLIGIYNHK